MQAHYDSTITLDSLAEMFDCTSRQFLQKFKSQQHTSPIDYLIQIRIKKAKELLISTDATIKEIAERVGYTDYYYFSRIFKKMTGISPTLFKEESLLQQKGRDNPSLVSQSPIVARRFNRYIDKRNENHYQYKKKGELPMLRLPRLSMAATLFFCFAVLLSACSTSTTTPAGSASPASVSTASPAASATPAAEAPRVIKHAMGETTITGMAEPRSLLSAL